MSETDNIKEIQNKKKPTLFNNPIDTEQAFGISRALTDRLNQIASEITPEKTKNSFKYNKTTFKVEGRDGWALRIIDKTNQIQTHEQFYTALERIKSGKVLQTFMALWAFANKRGGFIFSGVRLSEIMGTVLKTKNGYFTQPQKRDFTEAIQQLRNFEIFLDQTITDIDRGKKKNVVKRDFYKLIDLEGATYAKRNKDIIDASGRVIFKKGEADDSVVIKLYGELLPRFNKGIMRGRLYNRGLLELDANKDERAILLGFKLMTRFDQLRQGAKGKDMIPDNNLFIKLDRKTLIDWAGYNQTDKTNKNMANQHLINTLNKLIEVKCLRDYEPKRITIKDDLRITLYPYPVAVNLIDKGVKNTQTDSCHKAEKKMF